MKEHLLHWIVILFAAFLLALFMDRVSGLSIWQQTQVMFGVIVIAKLDEIAIRLKDEDE